MNTATAAFPASAGYRSKTVAAWLALAAGSLGAHRFYLFGRRDLWAWAHLLPTLVGLYGIRRVQLFGQDDMLSWALIPVLGLMVAQAMVFALVYALTPDEKWDAAMNPGQPVHATRWAPVFAAILALALGAGVLMATIAFGGQRYFEWQIEEARKISQ
jgi:hypothetical protein